MINKPITYTDFNGNTLTEDFWFHLSKSEITELQNSGEIGFSDMLQSMVNNKDVKTVVEVIKRLILLSIGERSADGKTFLKKTSNLARTFEDHAAYEVLFIEFAHDMEKFATWLEGIMPADLVAEIKAQNASGAPSLPPPPPAA